MTVGGNALPMGQDRTQNLYRYYALAVFFSVGLLNAADRQILSILAEAIKADLHISDSQIAFLYGTAFITLYVLLGLAVARLADRMKRTRLLAGGLALWSTMTALGGLAPNYAILAAARFGVGVGEATANPVSQSLICDYFPRERRGMALGVNLAGMFLGVGLAATVGGQVLAHWPQQCGSINMCGTKPWQAAFMIVGIPGILLAFLVAGLREPVRGAIDGHPVVPPPTGHWMAFWSDIGSVLPGLSTIILLRDCGQALALRSLVLTGGIWLIGLIIAYITGDYGQWIALSLAISAIVSWALRTNVIDPPLIALTFGTPAYLWAMVGYALIGCIMGAAHFWVLPFAIRTFGVTANEAGLTLGPLIGTGSILGVVAGGVIADKWRKRDPRGYVLSGIVALVLLSLALIAMLLSPNFRLYAIALFIFMTMSVTWSAAAGAFAQDLVLPRMRATAAAMTALCLTLIAMAGGPYAAGKVGELLGSLAGGLASLLVVVPFAIACLLMAARTCKAALESKSDRAVAAGEPR